MWASLHSTRFTPRSCLEIRTVSQAQLSPNFNIYSLHTASSNPFITSISFEDSESRPHLHQNKGFDLSSRWILNLPFFSPSTLSTRPALSHASRKNARLVTMAFWVCTGGHDMQNRINLDSLGQLYLAFAAVWTLLLLFGVAFLISNRKLPFLRVRKLPLGILAVCTLHVYWCLCMLAYVLNGFFACSMEYWVMSTYLPIGVALYQASNTQLRHVAGLQQQIAWSRTLRLPDRKAIPLRGWGRLAAKWSSYSFTQRAITCVSYGIAIQVRLLLHCNLLQVIQLTWLQILCTAVIFCLSRRFHASWGALGSEVDAAACRKGWEW